MIVAPLVLFPFNSTFKYIYIPDSISSGLNKNITAKGSQRIGVSGGFFSSWYLYNSSINAPFSVEF